MLFVRGKISAIYLGCLHTGVPKACCRILTSQRRVGVADRGTGSRGKAAAVQDPTVPVFVPGPAAGSQAVRTALTPSGMAPPHDARTTMACRGTPEEI